jgi:hypothetical protein
MADRPRSDDWWLASDGKWYPPDLHPAAEPDTTRDPPPAGASGPTDVSRPLTHAVTIALMAASSLFIVAAFYGFRYAEELRSGNRVLTTEDSPNLLAFGGWLALALVAFLVAAVLTVVWTALASRVLDARGASGRRWRGGWTVGSWIIPIGNLVLPKLVYNELERGLAVPYRDEPIGESWRSINRTTLADAWWALWIGGLVVSQGAALVSDVDGSDEEFALALTINSAALLLIAAAGIALLFVIRRMAVVSTT